MNFNIGSKDNLKDEEKRARKIAERNEIIFNAQMFIGAIFVYRFVDSRNTFDNQRYIPDEELIVNNELTSLPAPLPFHVNPNEYQTIEEKINFIKRKDFAKILPVIKYSPKQDQEKRECTICMCVIEVNELIKFLPCLHTFHQDCVDAWISRDICCPTCGLSIEPVNHDIQYQV